MNLKEEFRALAGRARLEADWTAIDESGARALLSRALPGLVKSGSKLTRLKAGGENTVWCLDGRHVIKIADHADSDRCAREVLIQRRLFALCPDMVPAITAVSADYHVFAMERRPGKTRAEAFQGLSPEEIAERLAVAAGDMIRFLDATESAFTLEEAAEMSLDIETDPATAASDAALLREALSRAGFLKTPGTASAFLTEFEGLMVPSFLRHDSNDRNLLLDPATGHVTAVIDFGFAGIVPRFELEDHYTGGIRRVGGTWRVAHRSGVSSDRPTAHELVNIARRVAAKYGKEGRLPSHRWLENLELRMEGNTGGYQSEPARALRNDPALFVPPGPISRLRHALDRPRP
jgi:hypothetical protein